MITTIITPIIGRLKPEIVLVMVEVEVVTLVDVEVEVTGVLCGMEVISHSLLNCSYT